MRVFDMSCCGFEKEAEDSSISFSALNKSRCLLLFHSALMRELILFSGPLWRLDEKEKVTGLDKFRKGK